jgi:transglutaminase-like putative cysteine protease
MTLDLLLALLWTAGGTIAATADGRWGWALAPLAAAGWSLTAGALRLPRASVPRRPEGFVVAAGGWLGAAVAILATHAPREAAFPVAASAVFALFLFQRRSALQGHAVVLASFVAAVLGAVKDAQARSLPLFLPFLVLLVLCLALVHQQWVLQRLRRAAQEGYLLAAQVPGFAGTRTGIAPAITVVTLTTTAAALFLYVAVPHLRWRKADELKGEGGAAEQPATGMSDELTLGSMHELLTDRRVALRMKILVDGRPVRPTLPTRLRASAVDTTDGVRWWSDAERRLRTDGMDGETDGWIRIRSEVVSPVHQEFECEAEQALVAALPDLAQVRLPRAIVDGNGAVRLPEKPDRKFSYAALSDHAGPDPDTYEPAPRSPNPRFLAHRNDPEIRRLATEKTWGAATAEKRARMLEQFFRDDFEYSLAFDPGGERDPVRGLLFGSRSGYCVHFAAAMCVMLRHLGIPCRIAQGLQGGEWNDREQVAMFRYSDAHAWVEVWLGSKAGWVPFDPTPRTAEPAGEDPEDFAGGRSPPPDSAAGARPPGGIAADPLSRLNLERQSAWLRGFWKLFEDAWRSKFGKGVVLFAVMAFSLAFTWRLLPRHEQARIRAVFLGSAAGGTGWWDEFVTLAARAGFRLAPGETPFEFGKRVERSYAGAARVPLALYAVRWGRADAGAKAAEVRPILDGIRRAQAGKAKVSGG